VKGCFLAESAEVAEKFKDKTVVWATRLPWDQASRFLTCLGARQYKSSGFPKRFLPIPQGDATAVTVPQGRAPIGVFDSGVGGLSVLRVLRAALPAEDFVYVADTGFAPYGDRSPGFIQERARVLAEYLVDTGAKAIVVACNTATAAAVHALRAHFTLPIVAMEPAVKPAVSLTRSGVIGVLATSRTLASERLARLVERHTQGVEVLLQPCPGLMERVEAGDLEGPATRALVERYVCALVARGADTLVLGCTHYAFLLATIGAVAGTGVTLIDPAAAVARELLRRLYSGALLADRDLPGGERFFTSGDPALVTPVVAQLWGEPVVVQPLPPPTQGGH